MYSEGKMKKKNSHSKISENIIVKQTILELPHKRADDENGFSNWNFVQNKNNLNSELPQEPQEVDLKKLAYHGEKADGVKDVGDIIGTINYYINLADFNRIVNSIANN
uniref:Uncharacterized protein n=1 Tax=Glossina austeni TaxID=7395 RepID=A0A1A9V5T6_GLOAU